MDKFDQGIIELLRQNARHSISHIAAIINLSRSAVSDRIKKLEQRGVIRGYQVLLSESQKSTVSAYFEIQHSCARCTDAVDIFKSIPEVVTCRGVSGEMDILVYLQAESMSRLHEIREHIDNNPSIIRLKTHIVMSEWINNRP